MQYQTVTLQRHSHTAWRGHLLPHFALSASSQKTATTAIMATISSLSQELICRIVEFLPQRHDYSHLPVLQRPTGPNPSQLPPYACISRPWQHAIERRTFEAVTIDSNHVADLGRVLVAHRRHLLRVLTYDLVIRTEDVQNNVAATRAIHDLFVLLSSWGVDAAGQTMRLNIGIAYPNYSQPLQPVVVFNDPEDLPSISRITELEFVRHQRCNFDGPSAFRLAARLPSLEKAWLSIHDDPELMSTAERRAMRLSLAQALPALASSSLTSLHIDAPDCAPQDETFSPPRLIGDAADDDVDPLSLALHRLSLLSPHLTTLRISGALTIDPSLFWPPPPPDGGGSTPSWPSLTTLIIQFSMATPDGDWYFTGTPQVPPDDDNDSDADSLDSDPAWDFGASSSRTSARAIAAGMYPARWFRRTPDAARINPLFLAVARAAARMPRLERLEVSARARCGGGGEGGGGGGGGDAVVCETAVVAAGRRHRLDKRFGGGALAGRDRKRVYVAVPGMAGGLLDGRIVDVWSDGGRRLVRVVDT